MDGRNYARIRRIPIPAKILEKWNVHSSAILGISFRRPFALGNVVYDGDCAGARKHNRSHLLRRDSSRHSVRTQRRPAD